MKISFQHIAALQDSILSHGQVKLARRAENPPGVILVRSGSTIDNGQLLAFLSMVTPRDASLALFLNSPEEAMSTNRFFKNAIAKPIATSFTKPLPDLRIVSQSEARVTILKRTRPECRSRLRRPVYEYLN